jgi:hypothetical protein
MAAPCVIDSPYQITFDEVNSTSSEQLGRRIVVLSHAKAAERESTRSWNGPFQNRVKFPTGFQCCYYRPHEDDDLDFMLIVTLALPIRTFSRISANHANISACATCSSVDLHTAKSASNPLLKSKNGKNMLSIS